MHRVRQLLCISAAVALLPVFSLAALWAEPVGNQILDKVAISTEQHAAVIQIRFASIVSYVTHFPQNQGDTLLIKIRPELLGTADQAAALHREAPSLPPHAGIPLEDVVYEGDTEGGPYVVLHFSVPVKYEVSTGTDFRSLTVLVHTNP
jgi:hypothetical protein